MALRLAHIVTKMELGGAQKNVLDILSLLDRTRYELFLVTSPGLLSQEAGRIKGVRVFFSFFLTRLPNPLYDCCAFVALFFFFRRHKIQVVHTHSSKAGIIGRWAAKCAGVRLIAHTVHGWGFRDYQKDFFNELYIFLERLTARVTNFLIVVTQSDLSRGLAHRIGSQEQYRLVPYGLSRDSLERDESRESELKDLLGLDGVPVITMIACLKPQKNPLDFIKMAARLKNSLPGAKFLLVGDGVLRPLVEKEAHRMGLGESFFLLGWRRDIPSVLAVSDVLVLTSLWEGLPFALLEAMSFSKPVVAYDVCGLSELVRDGFNGFLVVPGDVEALSQRVLRLLTDIPLRRQMGLFAQHTVSVPRYTQKAMLDSYQRLYDSGPGLLTG